MKTIRDALAAAGLDQDATITMGPSQMHLAAKRIIAGDMTRAEWNAINDTTRTLIAGMVMGLVLGKEADSQYDRLRAMVFVVQPGTGA